MNKSRLSLVISLAALLSGGLVLPNAASAHDYHDRYQDERPQQRSERRDHGDHNQRHSNDNWYLQRHREVRYYDERPMKHRRKHGHKHGYKHGHKHAHKIRRQQRDLHRDEYRVYQPVAVEHEYRRVSPLRLEIGYEIVL